MTHDALHAPRILIADDEASLRKVLSATLRKAGYDVETAHDGQQALALLQASEDRDEGEPFQLLISDLKMPKLDGMELLERVNGRYPDVPVLMLTAHGTVDLAVQALKRGAFDFLTKPYERDELLTTVRKALAQGARDAEESHPDGRRALVGESQKVKEVLDVIARVADTPSTVLIRGESGTGKELVARAIHAGSRRKDGPFIRVNCGALPESLLDSELFGHEKGAFTGAERRRRGRFELADGGTLFLDEIATVPHSTQVRLLRVLQERELERVGGEETVPVDVRIIAATNVPPDELLKDGTFREDLFYRLHVVPIVLPPLRERKEDIPLLVNHFIEKLRERTASPVRAASPEALKRLAAYDWPGNVRELENVIERALVLADREELGPEDLPPLGENGRGWAPSLEVDGAPALPEGGLDLTRAIEDIEERLLRQALEQAGGVKAEAARLLGLKPSALYYKLEKYGIEA